MFEGMNERFMVGGMESLDCNLWRCFGVFIVLGVLKEKVRRVR